MNHIKTMQDAFLSKISENMAKDKETFIKQMLLKKGYPELANANKKVRFPKLNCSVYGGWEYFFADNGTQQGDFIVAVGPWEPDYSFPALIEDKAFSEIKYTFQWQDKNFDPVRL